MTAGSSSIPAVQSLLRALACGRRAAEAGTALGEGAEAIAASARSLLTVELDSVLAGQARRRFAERAEVEVVEGDWRDVLPQHGPFEFLFLDGGAWKGRPYEDGPVAVALLAKGGILLIDDMTPNRSGPDSVRSFIFEHEELEACEVLTTPQTAALVAVRR